MTFLADEGVDREIVESLRLAGFRVDHVLEIAPGSPDDVVLEMAASRNAVLLTADKDFGDLVYRKRLSDRGVVFMRLAGLSVSAKSQIVVDVLTAHGTECEGSFVVISPGAVRIRRPDSGA